MRQSSHSTCDPLCKNPSPHSKNNKLKASQQVTQILFFFTVSSADIKRIKMSVDNLYIEKQKAEKNEKAKKPTKGKGKAKLKVEGDNVSILPNALMIASKFFFCNFSV